MSYAFVFPGQGSQTVGMGKELSEASPTARRVFEEVDDALGEKLSALMFAGDADRLTLTENTQPALMAVSVAAVRLLLERAGMTLPELASFVAGHSLGEYSALAVADSLTVSDAARLLRRRGQAMQSAAPLGIGGMAALMGMDIETAREIAREAAAGEVCATANDNAPGQVVVSGHLSAVRRAVALAEARGARKCVFLPVSAPFHSPLMDPAHQAIAEALADVAIAPPTVPVISNVTAEPVSDPEEIRRLLGEQVTHPVRWRESVMFMARRAVTTLVECGVGRVLGGMARRIDRKLHAFSLHTPAEIDAFLASLRDQQPRPAPA